ncbi:MAG: SUF system NifU family Fe-S cluster assembly protein [Ardenticatenia bacterium]|nr:SUF system NifU family Fe-S cluster assembly protein [Ardenticatenia bacterium]
MDDLYREYILDHYKNPRNYGTLANPDISYEDDNPVCGDRVRIDIKIENGRIADIRFQGEGCAISQASASILTEMVKGKPLDEVRQLSKEELLEQLGISLGPVRIKCALLGLKVLKAGVYGLRGWPEEEHDA